MYRRRPDHLGGDVGTVVGATPQLRRGGAILAIEGDRWIVTLWGYLGEQAPVDPEGFTAFAASLAAPDVVEVIRDAEPLEDARVARYPANLRRRYGRLDRSPDGFLVVGDAVCGFNPIYGQGMTVAASEALALRDCLRHGTAELGLRFRARTGPIVDIPWQIAVGSDLRFPEVGRAFLRVVNLIDRPERLLRPAIALRVLRGQRRARLAHPAPDTAALEGAR